MMARTTFTHIWSGVGSSWHWLQKRRVTVRCNIDGCKSNNVRKIHAYHPGCIWCTFNTFNDNVHEQSAHQHIQPDKSMSHCPCYHPASAAWRQCNFSHSMSFHRCHIPPPLNQRKCLKMWCFVQRQTHASKMANWKMQPIWCPAGFLSMCRRRCSIACRH